MDTTFEQIMCIDNHISYSDFLCIFEESLAAHLWKKFCSMNNTLYFFNTLTDENKKILQQWAIDKNNSFNVKKRE